MKKILCALALGAVLFASCTKEQTTTHSPKVRQFSYEMCGNSMYSTKAVNSSDVLQAINATLPESIALSLKSQSTRKYFSGKTGEGIVLPSDTYSVLGSVGGTPTSKEITTNGFLASTPKIDISQDLTITNDVTDYTLNATYGSFAIVIDATETEKAILTTYKGTEEIQFITSGDSRVTFAQGDFSNVYVDITLIPIDKEKYKETNFKLSTTQHSGIGFVQNGLYYVLHPTADGEQPKICSYDLPTFAEGTL